VRGLTINSVNLRAGGTVCYAVFCRQARARKKEKKTQKKTEPASADFSFLNGPDWRMGRQEQLCQQCKRQHKHSTYNTVRLELESLMWSL
jgi:hypothetical protein